MFLSDLLISESLKPGVSMRVILPVRPTLTHEVTAAKDLPDLKWHALYFIAPGFSLAKILAISDKAVDLPWPHSPKTQAVNLSALSFCYLF